MPRLIPLIFHPDPQSTSLVIMALMIDVGFRAFHVSPCWPEACPASNASELSEDG